MNSNKFIRNSMITYSLFLLLAATFLGGCIGGGKKDTTTTGQWEYSTETEASGNRGLSLSGADSASLTEPKTEDQSTSVQTTAENCVIVCNTGLSDYTTDRTTFGKLESILAHFIVPTDRTIDFVVKYNDGKDSYSEHGLSVKGGQYITKPVSFPMVYGGQTARVFIRDSNTKEELAFKEISYTWAEAEEKEENSAVPESDYQPIAETMDEGIIASWVEGYAGHYSADGMDLLLNLYSSPEGMEAGTVSITTLPNGVAYYLGDYDVNTLYLEFDSGAYYLARDTSRYPGQEGETAVILYDADHNYVTTLIMVEHYFS